MRDCGCEINNNGVALINHAVCDVSRAIAEITYGINNLNVCSCHNHAAIECIRRGIRRAEEGHCELVKGVEEFGIAQNCQVEKGLHEIHRGIKCCEEGLEAIAEGNFCEGRALLIKGVCEMKRGLCNVTHALRSFC